jgi:hypothetical protein
VLRRVTRRCRQCDAHVVRANPIAPINHPIVPREAWYKDATLTAVNVVAHGVQASSKERSVAEPITLEVFSDYV